MNIFQSSYEARLQDWFQLRQSVNNLLTQEKCIAIDNWWQHAPLVNHYLHPHGIDNWPNPWELLSENTYCEVARALGIVYTIYFTGHKNLNPEIRVYYDTTTKERSNVAWLAGGKYILNFHKQQLVNTDSVQNSIFQKLVFTPKDFRMSSASRREYPFE